MSILNIKKEKLDDMDGNCSFPPLISEPPRKVILKKKKIMKKLASPSKPKDTSSLEQIKVKTLDEIMREKKIKKKKTTTTTPEVISSVGMTSSNDVSTVTSPTSSPVAVSRQVNGCITENYPLKQLSVRLFALPNGGRTFKVSPKSSVKIKQEFVEPSSPVTKSKMESTVKSTSLTSPKRKKKKKPIHKECMQITIKKEIQEPDLDINLNSSETPYQTEITFPGILDDLSDISDGSSDMLANSVDFSDVPLGSAQDEDTMSLYARDDIFEKELEPEQTRKHSSGSQRRLTKERNFRESLKNNSTPDRRKETETIHSLSSRGRDEGNAINNVNSHDTNKRESTFGKHRQSQERKGSNPRNGKKFRIPKGSGLKNRTGNIFDKYNNGRGNLQTGQIIQTVLNSNIFEEIASYPHEIERLKQLNDQVHKMNHLNPALAKVTANLQGSGSLNVNKELPIPLHHSNNFENQRQFTSRGSHHVSGNNPQRFEPRDETKHSQKDFLHMRVPPPVPGGRGFFEDRIDSNDDPHNCENGIQSNSWQSEEDRQISVLRKLSGDGLIEDTKDTSTAFEKKTSPLLLRQEGSKSDDQIYRKPLKRKSSSNDGNSTEEELDNGHLSPTAAKRRQVYCMTQLRLGKCTHTYCKFVHLSPRELDEFGTSKQVNTNTDNISPPWQEECQIKTTQSEEELQLLQEVNEQLEADEKEQMCKGLAEAASQFLDLMNLGEAWQVIQHLYQKAPTNKAPLLKILERTLVSCGEETVDTAVAAQVSSQVFDLIVKVRGSYNRHDFTTLIQIVCRTGQYIRAYEILDEMRHSNIVPTHEVFFGLINSSHAEPDRAFDLLDEIKSLGLFRSSICCALLNLGCKCGRPVIERTWSLFKEMVANEVQLPKESFMALLELLADNDDGQKVLEALVLFKVPSAMLTSKINRLIIKQSKGNADLVSVSVAHVREIAKDRDPQFDVETWNILLSNCYSDKFNLVSSAQEVYGLMEKFNVHLMPQGYNGLLCAFSEANVTISAMQIFKTMSCAKFIFDIKDCMPGLVALVNALVKANNGNDLESVVAYMIRRGLMVDEQAFQLIIANMEHDKRYVALHSLSIELETACLVPPISIFRKLVSSLEKWAEHPDASLGVYASMRRAYPIIPGISEAKDNAVQSTNLTSNAKALTPLNLNRTVVCKFFLNNSCVYGNRCRFLHLTAPFTNQAWQNLTPQKGNSTNSNTTAERKNPFVLKNEPVPLPPPPFCNPSIPPPPMYVPRGPFVLKEPNTFPNLPTSFGPPPPFPIGFPPSLLYKESVPGATISTTLGQKNAPHPSTIEAGMERHSLDLDSSSSNVVTRETRSAPVLPVSAEKEGFKFPQKTDVHFYRPRIEKATEEKDMEELARLYVEMKKELVPVNNEMLLLFYSSFTTCRNIGESLSSFVAIIDIQLDNPDVDEDNSQREALDSDDHKFIGELGVALMQFCRSSNRLDDGYLVLHVLHQYSVNYFQHSASFVPNVKVLSPQSIALLAADMCLCLEKDPQYDGALEVLRGGNYAAPTEGECLTKEENEKRRLTFEKLATHYLSIGNCAVVYEFLQQIGDKDLFGMSSLKSIYNNLLKRYIADEKVDDAIGIIREMETELISRDPNVLRDLVTCLGNIGRFLQSKEIFKSSCLQGAYPVFPSGDGLWKSTVWITFSKFEIQFYLEKHLLLLSNYVEQNTNANHMPYDETVLNPLRILISAEEQQSAGQSLKADAVSSMHEKIIESLCSDFNPPLSCGMSNKPEEVIVNPRSLRRWFVANPPSNRQVSPHESDGSEEHQRNVMTSNGRPDITVRLDVTNKSDAQQDSERIRHTICGHLTRYYRQGKISTREEFKRIARELAQDFHQSQSNAELSRDYKYVRAKVIGFVDKFFEKKSIDSCIADSDV